MKLKHLNIVLVWIVCGLMACRPSEINNPREYFTYLSNPKNGLIKEKSIAGIRYKIKYLPTEYLAYNASKNTNCTQTFKDSLIKSYNNSLTFLVNVGPAKGEDFDITRLDVANYEEFAQRIEEMAFGAQEWMQLKAGDKEYKPSIVRMENINAQDNSRNFMAVFPSTCGSEDLRKNDLCFSYSDELFNTGVNKFIFKSKDITELPEFKF